MRRLFLGVGYALMIITGACMLGAARIAPDALSIIAGSGMIAVGGLKAYEEFGEETK